MNIKIPFLSIIVPVYNDEDYLAKCIKSLINQFYENIEIIIVDDGSTDKSGEICEEFALLDERISVIHKSNDGAGSARNCGIREAKGEYIYFVDSDDWVENDLVERCLEIITEYKYDIIVFGYRKRYNEQHKIDTVRPPSLAFRSVDSKDILVNILERGVGLSIWDKLIKRKLIQDNNILFDNKKRGQDFTFVIKCYQEMQSICSTGDCLYNHRILFNRPEVYDQELLKNHIHNYELLKKLFRDELAKGSKAKNYLDKVFILWFAIVIPLNIAKAQEVSFNKKKETIGNVFESNRISDWLDKVDIKSLPNKLKVQFLLLKLESPLLLLTCSYLLAWLRIKFKITL